MQPFNEIMLQPSTHFERPADVLSDSRFDAEQKYQILRQWQDELEQLSTASQENMASPSSASAERLQQVTEAIREVAPVGSAPAN